MIRRLIPVLLASGAAGCAMTYAPPVTSPAGPVVEMLPGTRLELMTAVRRLAASKGMQVTAADDASGTLSTAPQSLRLTPAEADCGTTAGLDYLLDNRTSSRVSWSFVVDDGRVRAIATFQAEYKPGDVVQNITLQCVSKGTMERALLAELRASK